MNNFHIGDTIEFASDIQNIGVVEKLIDNQSAACELNDEVYGKLLLAVVEALNNAIVHGNKSDHNKKVIVSYVIDNEFIEYTITNEGDGFNPDTLPDPTAPENIEKDCGRGIFLMRHLADEVIFSDKGRTVTLKFKLKE